MTKMYIVRGVPSGDTLLVVDAKTPHAQYDLGKLPKISIEGLQCPRPGRKTLHDGDFPDEEGAFEAREFVRQAVIGKQVKFTNYKSIAGLDREVGEVYYKDGDKVVNLAEALIQSGHASISEHAERQSGTEYNQALAAAELEAMENKAGKHADHPDYKSGIQEYSADQIESTAKILKGKRVKAVIESVFAGHAMKVYLPDTERYASIQLTGVICDKRSLTVNKEDRNSPNNEADRALWEKTHADARNYAERLLNHKEMTLLVEGFKYDNLLVSIENGNKVFQEELLKLGLASVFQPTVSQCTHRERLRAAELVAKTAKAGRWANIPTMQIVTTGGAVVDSSAPKHSKIADFKGEVVQMLSADTLIVKGPNGKDIKCGMANVRAGGSTDHNAPKKSDEGPRGASSFAKMTREGGFIKYSNWYLESRDFMGKLVLGKTVDVKVEYMSELQYGAGDKDEKNTEIRASVTLYIEGGANPGMELIKAGYGVPMPSKEGESRDYFAYCDAFEEAKDNKKGMHSGKGAPDTKVQDMNRPDDAKGRAMLSYFQRSAAGAGVPKLKAYVDLVLSPMRVRLYVPREKAQISMNLAGLAAPSQPIPNSPSADDAPDPFAAEAISFTKRQLNQREVEIQVEHFHKGTFVGNLYVDGKNYAPVLLSEGFATTEGQNTQSMSGKGEAADAEAAAKKNKVGIWSPEGGMPRRVQENIERYEKRTYGKAAFQVGTPTKRVPVTITNADSATSFFFHTPDAKENIKKVQQLLHEINPDQLSVPAESDISRDSIVAAKFSEDKQWYRARVIRRTGKSLELSFLDYGNKETSSISQVRTHFKLKDSITRIPAQASAGNLAFIHDLEVGEPGWNEATDLFTGFVEGRDVTIALEYMMQKNKFFTVRVGEKPVQADLVKMGYSLVALNIQEVKDLAGPVGKLMNLELAAKKSRVGMWGVIHGDPRSYDDDL